MIPLRPLALLLGLAAAVATTAGPATAGQRSVLAELFTSEGCSSCPPAHAVIGRLANDPDILALSFHVDYWDYIGWKDRFAAPWATERQRRYAMRLSNGSIYTPQMVISGRRQDVGSIAPRIMGHVRMERSFPSITLRVERDGPGHAAVLGPGEPGEIYFVRFDRRQESHIKAGENQGRSLPTFNVVRTYMKVADWDGKAGRIPLGAGVDLPGEVAAVIVQGKGQGELLACAVEEAPASH